MMWALPVGVRQFGISSCGEGRLGVVYCPETTIRRVAMGARLWTHPQQQRPAAPSSHGPVQVGCVPPLPLNLRRSPRPFVLTAIRRIDHQQLFDSTSQPASSCSQPAMPGRRQRAHASQRSVAVSQPVQQPCLVDAGFHSVPQRARLACA